MQNNVFNMIKIKFLPFLMISLTFLGCEKNNEKLSAEIKAGDNNNMIVTEYDTLIDNGYQSKYFSLDLDNNGEMDIQFQSINEPYIMLQTIQKIIVTCADSSVKILGYQTADTLFQNIDTVVIQQTSDSSYIESIYYKLSYNRKDINDSIVSITNSFRIKLLNDNDLIRKTDSYRSTEYILEENGNTYPEFIRYKGDTAVWTICLVSDISFLPEDNYKYIGFLINNEKLGWIKIQDFGYYNLMIYESAIQK